MGLVNFRVTDELKKSAFKIMSDLGKTPTDVFKNVMQYIVTNGKLPIEEVLMTPQDHTNFKAQFNNSVLSQKLHEIIYDTSLHNQICISADTGSGALQGITDMIDSFIADGSGCLIAHPAISCSETAIDRILSLTTKYEREVKLLSLKPLFNEEFEPELYYNPLRGKSFDDIAMFAMNFSPSFDFSNMSRSFVNKLVMAISPILSAAFEGDSNQASFSIHLKIGLKKLYLMVHSMISLLNFRH